MTAAEKLEMEWTSAVNAVRQQMSTELREHDAVAACIYGFMTRVNFTVTKPRGLDVLVLYLTLALLTKAFKTYQAVSAVATQGLGEDASALLRSLYETAVAIDFILRRESKLRARVYLAYAAHRKVAVLNSWQTTKGLKRSATRKRIKAAKDELAAWVGELPSGTAYERHWSGHGNFDALNRTMKFGKGYDTFYRFASGITHAEDAESHLRRGREGKVTMNLLPGDKHVREALRVAPALLWLTVSRINARFGFDYGAELEAVRPWAVRMKPR